MLWVTWAAKANGDIWYTTYNGTAWAAKAGTLGKASSAAYAPAMAEDFDSNAYIAWTTGSGHIDWEILVGLGEKVYTVPGARTDSGPALADTGHKLYFAYKGQTADDVDYVAFDGSAYSSQESLPQALTNVAPALANSGLTLCAGWKGATTDHVYAACLGAALGYGLTTTTTTSSTTVPGGPPGTVVAVTTGAPATFTFSLSTSAQPKIVSDEPAIELDVPAGLVTFNVTNPEDNILSHDFKVCSAPLPGPVTTLPRVQELPDSCTGAATPVLAPGGPTATLKVDFAIPGAYEYLSTVGGPSGDASDGMKGVLNVT